MQFIRPPVSSGATADPRRAFDAMFDADVMRDVATPRHLAVPGSLPRIARYVAAHPANLTAHTQRAFLAEAVGDRAEVLAAVVDMKRAIGDGGKALVQMMHDRLSHSLGDESMEPDVDTGAESELYGCVIAPARANPLPFITRRNAPSPASHNVAVRAEALLSEGRIDTARSLLEQSVQEDPQDLDASECLLFVYRSTHDVDGFRGMLAVMRRLAPSVIDKDPMWRGTEQYLDLVARDTMHRGAALDA